MDQLAVSQQSSDRQRSPERVRSRASRLGHFRYWGPAADNDPAAFPAAQAYGSTQLAPKKQRTIVCAEGEKRDVEEAFCWWLELGHG